MTNTPVLLIFSQIDPKSSGLICVIFQLAFFFPFHWLGVSSRITLFQPPCSRQAFLFLSPSFWTFLVTLEMAGGESDESFGVELLEAGHRQGFEQALMRVLKTGPAEHTLAEIIDGLPTRRSYIEFHWPQDEHPANQHDELCPGIIERARELRSNFAFTKLRFKLPAGPPRTYPSE